MADERRNEEPQYGTARTVEAYHIEEAVRQAQLARAGLVVRLPLRDRGEVIEVRPAGIEGPTTQGGTPYLSDEPHETWETESP